MSGGAPANLDAERAVLGAFFKDNLLLPLHSDKLEPDDFFHEPHRYIYEAVLTVNGRGDVVDVITIGEALSKENRLQAIGGAAYIADIVDECATTIGVEYHIGIISEKARLRNMITAATAIATEGYAHDVDLDEFLSAAEKKVFDVLQGGMKQSLRHIEEVVASTVQMLQAQQESGAAMAGIPSGFGQLDAITMGLQNTDLIILAARPGMGKTSLALSIAANVATLHLQTGNLDDKKGVALFSLEMGAEQLAMRLMSSEGHVNLKDVRGGRPSMEDFRRLTEAAGRLAETDIFLDDSPSVSLAEVRTRCRRLKLQGRLHLILVDYLQLMRPSSNKLPREQQISEMSRGLKALAKELNVPVICLSQLNRSLESRQDKRPMLSDLRESGAIEQDADLIMFVYRDEYYNLDSDDKGIAEIIVGKQRNGPCDTARVAFIGKYTKFANLTPTAEF